MGEDLQPNSGFGGSNQRKLMIATIENILKEELPKKDLKKNTVSLESLQYQINIVLPESKYPAIYYAICKKVERLSVH